MKRTLLLLTLTLLGGRSILTAQQVLPPQMKEAPAWVTNAFTVAQAQSEAMYKEVMKTKLLPRSIQRGLQPKTDWTAGFSPVPSGIYMPTPEKIRGRHAPKMPPP